MTSVLRLWPLVLAACSFTPPGGGGMDVDARPGDGPDLDAPPGDDRHLLITEVLASTNGEFVEIYNPTSAEVDLSTYYLSDHNEYWKLPGTRATPATTINIDATDHLLQFPIGAKILPGEVQVIASSGTNYAQIFGTAPTYTMLNFTPGALEMRIAVDVANPPATSSRLTDVGELVVLFQWDGQSDLVHDVDMVVHGLAVGANRPVAKGSVDGPDVDVVETSYPAEPFTIDDLGRQAASGESYKRTTLEAGAEMRGGNGITGHAETSEDIDLTWDSGTSPATPGTIPNTLR